MGVHQPSKLAIGVRFPARALMKIADVPSGAIELVFDGKELTLQFNCSCDDALPWCHAICCRLRPHYNTLLSAADVQRAHFATRVVKGLPVLDWQDATGNCTYLEEPGRCGVHGDKPVACQRWHCSPGGVGDALVERGSGWILLPRDITTK